MDPVGETIKQLVEESVVHKGDVAIELLEPSLRMLLENVFLKRRTRLLRKVRLLLARRRTRELTALCLVGEKKAKVSNRSAWVLPRPTSWFDAVLLNSYEDDIWMENFHVTRKTFQYICSIFGPEMARQDTAMRESIPVEKRVAAALYRLATGSPYFKTGEKFGIGRCTSLKIKDEFCAVLVKKAKDFIKFPMSEAETNAAIEGFEQKCRVPQVVGTMYAVRFKIRAPSLVTHKMKYYNDALKCHSMTLQAVVDSQGRFINVSSGYPGGISNVEALKLSDLHRNVNQGVILQSPSRKVEGIDIHPIIATDSSYKLRKWCVCPFSDNTPLSPSQGRFNEELDVAVQIARDAVANLRGRWGSLAGNCLEEHVEKIPETLLLCCVLHNICVDQKDATIIMPHYSEFESLSYVEANDEDIDEVATPLNRCYPLAEDIREALRAHVDLL